MTHDPGSASGPVSEAPRSIPHRDDDRPPSAPADRASSGQGRPAGQRRSHRPWSARGLPSALVAVVVLAAAVAALYDVLAVRAGGTASPWRRRLADELGTRPTGDVWMLTGAAIAAVLGLWLIILALTPGLRHRLPLYTPRPIPDASVPGP
ncbi:hypothetical protein ACWGQ5_14420 [Streptomyces sp. NPDC055722]